MVHYRAFLARLAVPKSRPRENDITPFCSMCAEAKVALAAFTP
jgi:hypothetical protein